MVCSMSLSSVFVTEPIVPFHMSITRFFRNPTFSMLYSARVMRNGFMVIGCSSV